jgi:hypothetical protein
MSIAYSREAVKECIDFIYQKDIVDIDFAYDYIGCIYNYVMNVEFTEKVQEIVEIMIKLNSNNKYATEDLANLNLIFDSQERISVYVVDICREVSKAIVHLMYKNDNFSCRYNTKELDVLILGILAYVLIRNGNDEDKGLMSDIVIQVYNVNHKAHNVDYVVDELRDIYKGFCWNKKTNTCRSVKEYQKSVQKVLNFFTEAKGIIC